VKQEARMPEPEGADLGALSDLCTPWCVHVVATLWIADHLAAGTTETDDLATAAGCDADSLARVLRHLVGKGVFREPAPGRFALNQAAQGLRHEAQGQWLDLEGIGGRMAHAWGTLLTAVRTGRPAYHEVFGRSFWEDLDAHPDLAASFDALMGPEGHGVPDGNLRIPGSWAGVQTVVDVGSGTGSFLAEILRAHPRMRGILVDHPGTVERSREIFEAACVAHRVTTVGQSFFDPLPAGADLYLLRKVLTDWPDRETGEILRRCAEAARPNGRIVVLDGVAASETDRDLTIENVLLGGRTNTLKQFGELAYRTAGLLVWGAEWPPSGSVILELRPI
jgi:precorrin-6B methylase 2